MLSPLKFEPFLRPMIWGGEKIAAYKQIETPIHDIGESWEISGYGDHLTAVADGPLAGKTLPELVREYKGALVGEKVYAQYGEEFPLLIKFIDAQSDLSIQVHPDDAMAAKHHGAGMKGKTEMWYVIGADPGACLYCGLKKAVTPEEYAAKVADGTITDILARYEVQEGDVFFLPAGRIHAICSGCLIAEIQQTSDLTYRIWDYGRLGKDGKPRQLHTALAQDAIDYTVYPSYRTDYTPQLNKEVEVVSCPYFTTAVLDLTAPLEKDLARLDSFLVVMCLRGAGSVLTTASDGTETCTPLHQGETLLIPACTALVRFVPEEGGAMKLLTSCIR